MRFEQKWTAAQYDPVTKAEGDRFAAQVPGNVQYDYAVSHNFGDFFFGSNVKQFDAIEDYWWMYTTTLQYEQSPEDRLWFVAEGIDYEYDILLDGQVVHSGVGMYHTVEVDVTDRAKPGSVLQIIIHNHPKIEGEEGRFQAMQSCKPPFNYGWDWTPRLITSGLWRDAYIETRGKGYIRSCEPFYTLNDTRDTAQVNFVTDADLPVHYTLLDAAGRTVYEGDEPAFTLQNVNLWWCHGEGEAYLYTWIAETADCRKNGRIGFRTVRLVQNTGTENEPEGYPSTRYPTPMTVELNGRRIFAQGSNWLSPDVFHGRVTEARYRELLTAAVDANMNLMRVWGGCGINKPEFYDICDELGLLVWQEFMLACGNYVGTKEYLTVLEQEATAIIRSLRSRPCLAFWCGGNELFNGWSNMNEQSHALRLLNKLCYELDFDHAFLYTSPLSGIAHGGYYFRDPNTGLDVLATFANVSYVAYTEFAVSSMASAELLKKIIPEEELFPVEATDAWVLHYGLDAWWKDSWICPSVLEHYFGKASSLEELVAQSNWLQSLGTKSIFEEARRQWPHCSMAVSWCFNEPWLNAANNSMISYPNVKKDAYYSIGNALRPVMASARIPHFDWKAGEVFSAEMWLLNSSNDTVNTTITATVVIDGVEYEQISWNTGDVEARTNKLGPRLNFVLPEDATASEMTLKLTAADGSWNNSYRLQLVPKSEEDK